MRVSMTFTKLATAVVASAFLAVIAYYNSDHSQTRGIASVGAEAGQLESVQIKKNTVSTITWQEQQGKIKFSLKLTDNFTCREFAQAIIFLQPEGISEDGEMPELEYSISCENGEFLTEFDASIRQLLDSSKTKPNFFERPEQLVVTRVVLEGAAGSMSISSYEIQALLGMQLRLRTSE